MKLIDYLHNAEVVHEAQHIILNLAHASKDVYESLKQQAIIYSEGVNSSGEMQLSHDIIADEIYAKAIESSGMVSCYVSEERENEVCFIQNTSEKLMVAYDPIDGSSVAGAGLAVGAAFGIYAGVESLLEATGNDLVSSFYLLFGSRMVLVITTGDGVQVFGYDEKIRIFNQEQTNVRLDDVVNTCSIGAMQHSQQVPGYADLILHWVTSGYHLRYSGSLTADANGLLRSGGGVFAYPYPKLRVLYECNPFAHIIEQAGGAALTLDGKRILDLKVTAPDDAVGIIMGDKKQVETAISYLNK